ncbi:hypothetical protein SLS53_006200 [Cytospora paraplurivora]|uniref:Thaumatin-like protein n=1 Tax=Cytospora paraplurivora TaxID=2898453 RepID=A0AAN9U5W6_9PEZI
MPTVTPPPSLERREDARGPKRLTITIENKMNEPLSTSYVTNPGAPTLLRGDEQPSTMAASATTSIVVPSGWAGNIAMGLAKYAMTGDTSLIEGSLTKQMDNPYLSVDIDVSYVNGFSVPITCSCNADNTVLSGCNLDLWSLGECSGSAGTENGEGACANPLRSYDRDNMTATKFFLPCQGAAFTWARDHANSNEGCQSGKVTCCVGTGKDGCPANPKQASE